MSALRGPAGDPVDSDRSCGTQATCRRRAQGSGGRVRWVMYSHAHTLVELHSRCVPRGYPYKPSLLACPWVSGRGAGIVPGWLPVPMRAAPYDVSATLHADCVLPGSVCHPGQRGSQAGVWWCTSASLLHMARSHGRGQPPHTLDTPSESHRGKGSLLVLPRVPTWSDGCVGSQACSHGSAHSPGRGEVG